MNSIWQQQYGNNGIADYLLVCLTVSFVWILRHSISNYFAGLLFRWLRHLLKKVERPLFNELVIGPLEKFVLVLVTVVMLYRLNFPPALNFPVYKFDTKELLNSLGTLLLISTFTSLIIRAIDFAAILLEQRAGQTPDHSDNQLIVFFKDFFKVLLITVSGLVVLRFAFGLNIGSLLTGLSILGAAIALALKESLENLIASFIIFFDKPFTTGDLVKVNAITGTVEKIGLRSTRIRTEQKTFVIVPNKQMVDSVLDNFSLRTQRRAELKLEFASSNTPYVIQEFVERARIILQREAVKQSSVLLSDLRLNRIVVEMEYYTAALPMAEFNVIREAVNLELLHAAHTLGLVWPTE
ncbi:MAG: mechanosensitive ion channel family protein [Bacteroidetes bacterium]|nr:mechanosensitive ion channel family protein [Bacteroidota bacterium]